MIKTGGVAGVPKKKYIGSVVELVWVFILILIGWACFAVLSEKPTKKKSGQKISDRTNELLQMLLFVSVCVVALWLFGSLN